MSDNSISPDEIKRRLILFLSITAEVWTDVLKTLPLHILIKNIAPACFKLKEICDKNVKSIHLIENARQFTLKLSKNDPDAIKQLEHLAANKCKLAGQFQLSKVWIGEQSQTILRHCPDLFNGCKILFQFGETNKSSNLFLECLSQLEEARPVEIQVNQRVNQVVDYWHHPTFQNCSRIDLSFGSNLSSDARMMNIFDWLHHQTSGVDCDGSHQQVRFMIAWNWNIDPKHIKWLINRCSEDVQRGWEPIDPRSFVLYFCSRRWNGQFRRAENKLTGETLGRAMNENGQPSGQFRLRRCRTEEETSSREVFYAGMFNQDRGFEFEELKSDEKAPKVIIY